MKIVLNKRSTEYSDHGFTLIEVIIAVVIMAIAAIPLLHAFSSSANTSSKALIKMRATNAAENIMEDIKGRSLDDVIKTYGGTDADGNPIAPNYDGLNGSTVSGEAYIPRKDVSGNPIQAGWKFTLTGSDAAFNKDINKVLDMGYTATIEIDPTFYPNANSLNLSDFDEISNAHSAIISVGKTLDEEAVNKFSDLAGTLATDNIYASMDETKRKEEFTKLYKREICIEITGRGTDTDADGNDIDLVDVDARITYLLADNPSDAVHQYVPLGTSSQKLLKRRIFTNTSNKQKFNSVFVLFDPIYENAKDIRDIIVVHNRDSVPFNLYIIAQNTTDSSWEAYRKKPTGGLVLEIYEGTLADGTQPITLYTNLHEDTSYQRSSDVSYKPSAVQCYLNLGTQYQDPEGVKDSFNDAIYNKLKNKKGTWENADAINKLNARDIDGKYLDASKAKDKIYDVRVTVTKDYDEDAGEWPIDVTLTGTLIDD